MTLNAAMRMLAANPRVLFLGQNVGYDGNVMFKDFEGIPMGQRLELPVAEEMQMGMSIGLSLMGYIPVSVYPRMDFLMLAMNQLVNHLDKLEYYSQGRFKPHVIIRTKVGSKYPLDAGPQHTQDHTKALTHMLHWTRVIVIEREEDAVPLYSAAINRPGPALVVEAIK